MDITMIPAHLDIVIVIVVVVIVVFAIVTVIAQDVQVNVIVIHQVAA